jgi:hypothetical protein
MCAAEYVDQGCRPYELIERLGRLISDRLVEPIRLELRCRAGERELMALDGRVLADIGLHRCRTYGTVYGLLDEERMAASQRGGRACGEKAGGTARRWALVATALLAGLLGAPAWADAGPFDRLPTVRDLPRGVIKVSPFIPGMGEHWANPKNLPLGPIYCVMKGKVICAEFMFAQKDILTGKPFERLRLGMKGKLPPVDHVDLTYVPHGHEGYEVPHYDLHMYFVPPWARFPKEARR